MRRPKSSLDDLFQRVLLDLENKGGTQDQLERHLWTRCYRVLQDILIQRNKQAAKFIIRRFGEKEGPGGIRLRSRYERRLDGDPDQ